MRVGVYGGSFNPIHIGHMTVAEDAIKDLNLDELIFVPAGNPYMKPSEGMASARDRYEMIKLAKAGNMWMDISSAEMDDKPSYTYKTLKLFHDHHPEGTEFALILGYDAFIQLPTWHKPEEIAKLAVFWVYNRGGENTISEMKKLHEFIKESGAVHRLFVPASPLRISSTDIRMRIQEGNSWEHLVPHGVADYIKANNLYGARYE